MNEWMKARVKTDVNKTIAVNFKKHVLFGGIIWGGRGLYWEALISFQLTWNSFLVIE